MLDQSGLSNCVNINLVLFKLCHVSSSRFITVLDYFLNLKSYPDKIGIGISLDRIREHISL